MSERTRLGLGVLAAAAVLGLAGDVLLRTVPVGVNVGLWVILLVGAVRLLSLRFRIDLQGGGRWLALPAIGFALCFAWRDSASLGLANTIAFLACLALMASHSRAGRIVIAGLGNYMAAGLLLVATTVAGVLPVVFGDVKWIEIPSRRWTRHAGAISLGIAITIPAVAVFGALLASADAVFAKLTLGWILDFDLMEPFIHIFWISVWAFVAGGILRCTLNPPSQIPQSMKSPISLGIVETAMLLGTIDALFLAFVLVQLRYLFGGAAIIDASIGISYSDYARRGFFELVAVAALAMPLLLTTERLQRTERPSHVRLFRWLAGAMVALLFVVMASALQRMLLYQDAFGMTELRLYTTAFMGWLAALFAWFTATVLRGRGNRFAFGALVAGIALVVVLDVVNPDALIVSTNTARMLNGQPFDSNYIASLSADAVPNAVTVLPILPEEHRRTLAKRLIGRWSPPATQDPRTWNWARQTAWDAVQANLEALQASASMESSRAEGATPASDEYWSSR